MDQQNGVGGLLAAPAAKALDWILRGGEGKRRRERERKEGRARDDGKGMDGIPLAEFRQAAEPVSASFQLLWLRCWKVGVDGFWRGGESRRATSVKSQSE